MKSTYIKMHGAKIKNVDTIIKIIKLVTSAHNNKFRLLQAIFMVYRQV